MAPTMRRAGAPVHRGRPWIIPRPDPEPPRAATGRLPGRPPIRR